MNNAQMRAWQADNILNKSHDNVFAFISASFRFAPLEEMSVILKFFVFAVLCGFTIALESCPPDCVRKGNKICGRPMNPGKTNVIKTFDNNCEMQFYNCENPDNRTKFNYFVKCFDLTHVKHFQNTCNFGIILALLES